MLLGSCYWCHFVSGSGKVCVAVCVFLCVCAILEGYTIASLGDPVSVCD